MGYIAIIPARSGSKGLKDKNIKLLNGKPLIYYSIQAALQSGCFDEVFVSTDSEHYRQIAIECGASVPFLRSNENATDTADSWDVVRETIKNYEKLGKHFDGFMLLQPTSPLRTADDIKNAFKVKKKKRADSVLSIVEEEHSPLYASTLPKNLSLARMYKSKYFNYRRQDLPTYYRLNGAIYLSDMDNFINNGTIYSGKVVGYIMPKERSIDIDEAIDFKIAEILIEQGKLL